jgi:hypothetical protein
MTENWKTYDDLIEGAAANRLPRTDALVGRALTVIPQVGHRIELRFEAADRVHWISGAMSGEDWCEVVEVAPDTYFIDMTFQAWPREALTLIVNLTTRRTLQVRSIVREEDVPGEPRVMQRFDAGVLEGGAAEGSSPGPTRDLIGLRTLNVYSPNHTYEHIYLSSERCCWQCLVGARRGHGDVDLASTYRFAEDQYVVAFREFRIPVASVFFLNFKDLRSTGKFLGVTAEGRVSNEPAGAILTKASMTFYPPGSQPA